MTLAATVIIPARDAAATIGQAVRAVRDQTAADGRGVEVVVVDDGSVDATGEVARAAGARVLRGAGDGPARARNLGLAEVATPLVIFTDADCAARPGFVAALLAPFADPAVGGAKGAYETEQRALVARFVQQEYEERYARMSRRPSIDFVDTYAAAYRTDLLRTLGGFDERYRRPSTEDQELSFRVAATGARLVFVPGARVAHLHAATLGAYARKKAKIGYFKVATLRRHPGKAVDDAHTPATLKLQVLLAWPALALALALGPWLALRPAPPAWGLAALLPAAAFALSALPLTARCLRRDWPVGLCAPALILVRASSLAAGLAAGLLAECRGGVLSRAANVA
ncbi:MAG: glycosyltransferase [Planctomycetes bacterium]|nr:glycosyltransferase [Planctomycetota bacterium]